MYNHNLDGTRIPSSLMSFEQSYNSIMAMDPGYSQRDQAIIAGLQQRGQEFVKTFSNGKVQYSFSVSHMWYYDSCYNDIGISREFTMYECGYDDDCNYRLVSWEKRTLYWKPRYISASNPAATSSAISKADVSFKNSMILDSFRDINATSATVDTVYRFIVDSLTAKDLTFTKYY